MLGMALVELLLQRQANLRVVSMDDPKYLAHDVEFFELDLTRFDSCMQACNGMDYVFHLAGVKGGVGVGRSKAVRFLEGNSLLNLQMLKAARECQVERYLFTSSIGVYPDREIFDERCIWDAPPHKSDWYGAWAKRFGELQCEAYLEEYGYETCIVRPAAIYGPYDNFDPTTAMVIPALVARALNGEDPLVVWGDGSQMRDFIYSKDCARGIVLAMEKYEVCDPINLGSGVGVSIRELVETICECTPNMPEVKWDTSKPIGNKIRLMNIEKAQKALGFYPLYSLREGVEETIKWCIANEVV